uniref:Uncharacterized protein n=1 Tax=Ignisphaera aggregans TaxID=334771 RepID=A0A7C2VHX6_9CREN
MKMHLRITLRIPTPSREACLSVLDSLEPDNSTTPQGISIKMGCDDKTLAVDVESEDVGVLTVRNTVDDILVHANLALKSIVYIAMEREAIKTFKLSRENDLALG